METSGFGYLVGSVAPEVLIRTVLDSWRSGGHSGWIVPLEGGSTRLKLTLERLDGLDHHDWLQELGIEYGGREKVVDAVADVVLRSEAAAAEAVALAQWVRENGKIGE
ncbi:hypothetical protein GCM10023320_84270 [Pseudonocardia adelaidensis]|uniref:Immunity protein 8 of polymorphic toxin system n=1 Tax=Pseudonocardia adelaidensis TaxID=648754 RepID=A0ABP9PA07_9PSEU